MRRILIATDGSDAAREAIEVGITLAQHEDAEAIFVHAVPLVQLVSINGFGLTGHVPYEPTPRDEGVLDDAMAVAKCEGVPAAAALLRGEAVTEIVAHADSVDADLIVVGTRGHGAIASALLGSVSRGILASSKRPVLIARAAPVRELAAARGGNEMTEPRHCSIRLALGEDAECPGPSCPFWVTDDGCVLEPLDFELRRSPELACHLVELRVALEAAGARDAKSRSRSLFYRRLNDEQAAEA